ncbi:hypothetical Protein YC6258_05426 [Gynuella sunshinyii YC6258]|uniref:Uncharacterized protein n=1 Tax=Gynuella sunshinyii YC6258 TaxID=1445510 RepID=A0A0C5VTE2_9GAMM|nr:hypothetical Protein YC6258_05426 [Gynuella sunshinyii YC6258]
MGAGFCRAMDNHVRKTLLITRLTTNHNHLNQRNTLCSNIC